MFELIFILYDFFALAILEGCAGYFGISLFGASIVLFLRKLKLGIGDFGFIDIGLGERWIDFGLVFLRIFIVEWLLDLSLAFFFLLLADSSPEAAKHKLDIMIIETDPAQYIFTNNPHNIHPIFIGQSIPEWQYHFLIIINNHVVVTQELEIGTQSQLPRRTSLQNQIHRTR